MSPVPRNQLILHGKGVSPGIAIAQAQVYSNRPMVIEKHSISNEDLPEEIERFQQALELARQDLIQIKQNFAIQHDKDMVAVFDAHLMILDDTTLINSTIKSINSNKLCAEYCYFTTVEEITKPLLSVKDDYLRQRIKDIRDVTNRVINHLTGRAIPVASSWKKPRIIAAVDLLPSQTTALNKNLLAGFALQEGGETSHTTILARSMGIPAVIAVNDALSHIHTGQTLIVDGSNGDVIINPTNDSMSIYERKRQQFERAKARFLTTAAQPACTADGKMVILSANIGLKEELDAALDFHAEGVGLFRTEFIYFSQGNFPDEEQQFQIYKELAEKSAPHAVIVRFYDIGSDKVLCPEQLSLEPNPALGHRGIRYLLANEKLLETQIRAILRASMFGTIRMMSPMISTLDEIRAVNGIIRKVKKQLRDEGLQFDEQIQHGIMIETPAAVTMADSLALECNFFSIGSNDLIQYTLAADRLNNQVADIYDAYHPAILRALRKTVRSAHRQGIWTGICGEMASDLYAIPLLIGVGIDELSVIPAAVPRLKAFIRTLDSQWCRDLTDKAMRPRTTLALKKYLERELTDKIAKILNGESDVES